MVTDRVRAKLYRLDDIYIFHKRDKKNHAAKIIPACIIEFTAYWRELEDREFDGLMKHETDELYFFINEKLYEICRAHLDLYWLTYDYDELPMYRNGDVPEPFWQEGNRRKKYRKRSPSALRNKAKPNT